MSTDPRPATPELPSDREILLSRVVDAPRALVWRIWTEPTQVHLWWGPTGFTTNTQAMDVRPGGEWRYTMHGPDGQQYRNVISYLEVAAPARLVFRHGGDAGGEPVDFHTTVTFDELSPTQTRVTMRSQFADRAQRDRVIRDFGALEGGKQTLQRMAEHADRQLHGAAASGEELVLQRVLRAPRELVYDVWTRAEHLAAWFGPKGSQLQVERLEVRAGGVFHYSMRFEGHPPMFGVWVFEQVVPEQRLVFDASFADEAGAVVRAPFSASWPLRIHSTVVFEDHAGLGRGTVLTMRARAAGATGDELATFLQGFDSMRAGWGGTFEQLEALLAKLSASD
ncbi:MAG: SRPBCC domain-containing protein [Planctomycetes bacterium]|nr:SRPBCC domain-containing protein [Planctomycetota bacterium]